MKIYEAQKNDFIISTDKSKLNIQFIHQYLSNESYWAKNIPVDTVKKSIDGSFCFGLYVQEEKNKPVLKQLGFARVITDHATFAYVADVFIIEKFRGKGLAIWLMETIMDNPELQGLRRWMLAQKMHIHCMQNLALLPWINRSG